MQNEIITFTSPKASVSEIFRTLRTNVQFMTASSEHNSILFTSTQAGDGKSWIAANLAITFAQAGKKVILVDTDMRRGRQHNIFELPTSFRVWEWAVSKRTFCPESVNGKHGDIFSL